ncbi:MAG TPA: DEAD/DEAH box helicase [Dermatophilaceae bacterium]|nr:DEAD/DEAH box helicase [Dermatophilaceae bacterium]
MSQPLGASWVIRLTDPQLRAQVGSGAFSRGLDYFRRGQVEALSSHPEKGIILATVSGTVGRQYQVVITPTADTPGMQPRWSGRCTCPMGWNCKHCVAAILVARNRAGLTAPPAPSPWENALASLTASLDQAHNELPQLALELTLTEIGRQRYGAGQPPRALVNGRTRIHVRALREGARGRWVKTGASWAELERPVSSHRVRPDHRGIAMELLTLHRSAAGLSQYAWGVPELFLESVGPGLWPLLQRARDAGMPLLSGDARTVVVDAAALTVTADLDRQRGLRLRPVLVDADGKPVEVDRLLLGDPVHGVALIEQGQLTLRPVSPTPPAALIPLLARGASLTVPSADEDRFFTRYYPALRRAIPVTATSGRVSLPALVPPRLTLRVDYQPRHVVALRWSFRYRVGNTVVEVPLAGAEPNPARDPAAERATLAAATTALADVTSGLGAEATQGAPADGGDRPKVIPELAHRDQAGRVSLVGSTTVTGMATATFTERVLPWLLERDDIDVEVHGEPVEYGPADSEPVLHLAVDDRGGQPDWFDLALSVTVDDQAVSLGQLISGLTLGEDYLLLDSGTYFPLSSPSLDRLRALLAEARELTDPTTGKLRVSLYQAGLWEQLVALGVVTRQSARWAERVTALLAVSDPDAAAVPVPAGVQAQLRPYQVDGFRWLSMLWDAGLGGVLADDMGLGKTLQTLTLLAGEAERGQLTAPVLVVAPTSVVGTWVAEAAKFAPGLRVAAVTETSKRRADTIADVAAGVDLVVTSYTLIRLDDADYGTVHWQAVILDEAQFVKNFRAKTYHCIRRLDRSLTLAITGTPLENSLMDLWAILSLTSPGLFPSPDHFAQEYRKPIEAGTGAEQLESLRRRIRPFMLRRTKEEVEPDLPPKQEQTLVVPMSSPHRRAYERHLQRERQRVLGLLDDLPRNRVAVLAALTKLRQAALDPALVDDLYPSQADPAKIDLLVEHLMELSNEGHRALVFSQFTRFLQRVRRRLTAEGIDWVYLDGRTKNRAGTVAEFREGTATAFLISLKAGGFGLTLTEADYVYVLDPWWNPAAEGQAIDRAHRIGQDKPVMVYRLVAEDSIEGKVVALQQRKRDLFGTVISEASLSSALGATDLRQLLSG